jgi:hypothetical protein
MKHKMSWRSLKFIPVGGDESQAITRKHKGFMHLCELFRYHPEKFTEWYPPDHTIRMRKRLLAAALREYISPSSLAEDVLEWLFQGREEDIRSFAIHVLNGVGWLHERPRTPEEAAAKQT